MAACTCTCTCTCNDCDMAADVGPYTDYPDAESAIAALHALRGETAPADVSAG